MYADQRSEFEEKNMANLTCPMRIHKLLYPPESDTLFYLHWHREFELYFLTKGTVRFQIEDSSFVLKEGECVFIRPDQLHCAHNLTGEACAFTAFVFYDSMLSEQSHSHFYQKHIAPVLQGSMQFRKHITPDSGWQDQLLRLLHDMDQIPDDQYAVHELLLRSRLTEIWHLLYQHPYSVNPPAPDLMKLRPALDYIQEHYMYDITLADLAGCIPMSEGQFCRIFKKQLHYSPVAWLVRHRIMESCRLLIDTDKKIADIANLTGFNNISYYNKTFQKIIGCTPTVYRQERASILHFT